jgi:hypothetical protein
MFLNISNMSFFNQDFWQGLVITLIGIAVTAFFSSNKNSRSEIRTDNSGMVGRIIYSIFMFMFWVGLLMFGSNLAVNGLEEPKTMIGLALFCYGFLGALITRFILFLRHGRL